MELFANEWLSLSEENGAVWIQVEKPGFAMKDFEAVLDQVPRLTVTKFANLQLALGESSGGRLEIGQLKPAIEATVSKDFMEASVRLNLTPEELERERERLPARLIEALQAHGVAHGILYDVLNGGMVAREKQTVALGTSPVPGTDAQLAYFELSPRRPVIREDGNADFFELQFIDEVKPGDWLGEKIPATAGTDGRNLAGVALPAKRGRDMPLKYDAQTVLEQQEGNKVVLRARSSGAVKKAAGKIFVQEMLIIAGDVGPQTGNISYDGNVQIRGTVLDGFTVTATKDISVLGEIGVGAVARIESLEGDVYIKGGIFGREKAVVRAGRSVFLKHAKDCVIEAAENIHVGLYAINCRLKSRYIHLDKRKGRLIGGEVQAKIKLVAAFIGNESESLTKVSVEGFDRSAILKKMDSLLQEYKKALASLEHMRREMDIYEGYEELLKHSQKKEYLDFGIRYEQTVERVMELEEERLKLAAYMSTKGDGEVTVMLKAFPRTMLQIKEIGRQIERITAGSFYVEKNTFFHE